MLQNPRFKLELPVTKNSCITLAKFESNSTVAKSITIGYYFGQRNHFLPIKEVRIVLRLLLNYSVCQSIEKVSEVSKPQSVPIYFLWKWNRTIFNGFGLEEIFDISHFKRIWVLVWNPNFGHFWIICQLKFAIWQLRAVHSKICGSLFPIMWHFPSLYFEINAFLAIFVLFLLTFQPLFASQKFKVLWTVMPMKMYQYFYCM